MAVLLEVFLSYRKVWGVRGAKVKFLERVWDLAIVIQHPVAAMTFWFLCPSYQLIPIPALSYLAVADMVDSVYSWHWRVIRQAHHVLTKSVQAVVKMICRHNLGVAKSHVSVGFAHRFLLRRTSANHTKCEGLRSYKTMEVMEGFDVIYSFRVIPREAG